MQATSEPPRKTYSFTLVYSGPDDLTDAMADALFEAGCDDALLGMQGGLVTLDFDREADSYSEALTPAIDAVSRSGQPLKLVRVEPL